MFRVARSLSRTFSTIVNFTVADFLNRSQKISVLNQIKSDHLFLQNDNYHLSFPIHHKQKHDNYLLPSQHLDDVDGLDVEKIISDTYNETLELIERLGISRLLQQNDILDLTLSSKYVFQKLNCNSKMFDYLMEIINDDDKFYLDVQEKEERKQEQEQEEKDDRQIIDQYEDNEQINEGVIIDQDEYDYYNTNTMKADFNCMKTIDEVETCRRDFYFKLKISETYKFIYKQFAY